MDLNVAELPYVIYACFVLHNFCEINKESVSEDGIAAAIACDKDSRPPALSNNYRSECNEAEG